MSGRTSSLNLIGIAIVVVFGAACSTKPVPTPIPAPLAGATTDERILYGAQRDIEQRRPREAIAALNPLIDRYIASHTSGEMDYYCTRSMAETVHYMALARSQGRNAAAIDPMWAEAYYLKGYALIELDRITEARASLQKASALSPSNSSYLSELAHTFQADRDWKRSLELFEQAENAAKISPDDLKTMELTRALRGQGFSLIELGRLDEAEAKFNASLAVDRNDRKAKNELGYIEELRKKDY
jgi:tetratricopeptide (TPR) repeat protein